MGWNLLKKFWKESGQDECYDNQCYDYECYHNFELNPFRPTAIQKLLIILVGDRRPNRS